MVTSEVMQQSCMLPGPSVALGPALDARMLFSSTDQSEVGSIPNKTHHAERDDYVSRRGDGEGGVLA